MSEGNPKKERFKHTRELVRIALGEMTQSEIAKLCRTSQGTVSEWSSGKSKAQLHVIRPLLHRYGNRLNRTTARVYLVEAPAEEAPRWEESAIGRRLIALQDRYTSLGQRSHDAAAYEEVGAERNALAELIFGSAAALPHPLEIVETMIKVHREELAASDRPPKIVRVDGPIVLRHTFRELMVVPHGPRVELEPVPVARWFVHHQQRGRFVLVRQRRRELMGRGWLRWKRTLLEAIKNADRMRNEHSLEHKDVSGIKQLAHHAHPFVDCADDAGRWSATIEGPLALENLLSRADQLLADPAEAHGPHDEAALPFLLRKMLVDEGYTVPGVEHVGELGYHPVILTKTQEEETHGKAMPLDTQTSSA